MPCTFRVDRNASSKAVPCGMNSLLYLGDSERAARKAFRQAQPGFNPWGRADSAYGVTLARWHEARREYVILETRQPL